MKSKPAIPLSALGQHDTPVESERDQISQNIEAVLEFYARENNKISRSQRILERISLFIGQPVFLGIILFFVVFWMFANTILRQLGGVEFDPPPFNWLQGIISLSALLTSTVVLAVRMPVSHQNMCDTGVSTVRSLRARHSRVRA